MVTNLIRIALGGAIGALLRSGISISALRPASEHFPFGTLLVNIVGSFAIGAVNLGFMLGRILRAGT